jgi:hypothetical protein
MIEMSAELIAPCGMNCALCSRYQNWVHNRWTLTPCRGCRSDDKKCWTLKRYCRPLREGTFTFCFECGEFPCERLERMDRRFRKHYRMSVIENLQQIRKTGVEHFLEDQGERWRCPKCGGILCMQTGTCIPCETGYGKTQN